MAATKAGTGMLSSASAGSTGSGDWSVPVVALFYEIITTVFPDFF